MWRDYFPGRDYIPGDNCSWGDKLLRGEIFPGEIFREENVTGRYYLCGDINCAVER